METIKVPVEFVTQREEFAIASTPALIGHILKLFPIIDDDIKEKSLLNPNGFVVIYKLGDFLMNYTFFKGKKLIIFIHKSNDMSMIDLFFKQNKMGEITGPARDNFIEALSNLKNNPDSTRKLIFDYEKN